jgi:hypothetical protein
MRLGHKCDKTVWGLVQPTALVCLVIVRERAWYLNLISFEQKLKSTHAQRPTETSEIVGTLLLIK